VLGEADLGAAEVGEVQVGNLEVHEKRLAPNPVARRILDDPLACPSAV
jgi:hypothetical protein